MEQPRGQEPEKSPGAPSPAGGERLPDNVDLLEDNVTGIIITGVAGTSEAQEPEQKKPE